MMFQKNPIRILHVVGQMNRGGIETWLMHILRHIDRERYQMDFLVHTNQPCVYDDEIRSLGSKVIPCLNPSRPWQYASSFKHVLHEFGPYNIVHSHVHHFSGYVLYLAYQARVPVRIAHSHLDSSPLEANAGLYRRLYLSFMKSFVYRYATLGLGCSQVATADLFGLSWKADPRWQILYYGIDMTLFKEPVDAANIRYELGIPDDAFVIGHVGRFQEQKNHKFILDIFADVLKREPQAYLLLVGEGSLKQSIQQEALRMKLSSRVIFAGSRPDIPKLMMSIMDIFLFPSLSEGLPVVSIEAQAAGLPLVLSDTITQELSKIEPLVKRLSLSQPVSVWSDVILTARKSKSQINQLNSLAIMENSEFNVVYSLNKLIKVYAN